MLLGEPERTQADLNFALFGFPVRVHPFFWLMTLILGMNCSDAADVALWVVALFLSILIHELGHALVMRAYGFRPRITLYGMGGLASYGQPQGFQARGHGPLQQILISLAGPGAGFVLAGLMLVVVQLSGSDPLGYLLSVLHLRENLPGMVGSMAMTRFVFNILQVSVFWGIVNLMPVYPLDGGQIARELLLLSNPRDGIRQSLWLSIFTASGLAVVGFVQFGSFLMAIMFGYLAAMSYMALQAYGGQGRGW